MLLGCQYQNCARTLELSKTYAREIMVPKNLKSAVVLAVIGTVFTMTSALSADVMQGTIYDITSSTLQGGHVNGYVMLYTQKPATGAPPSCASQAIGVYVIDPNTAAGRAMIATAIAAHSQGRLVDFFGSGNCNYKGDVEDLISIRMH